MARSHDSERYDLSDAEKRDLIKLVEQGKPLPEKYRFLLFADKRETEFFLPSVHRPDRPDQQERPYRPTIRALTSYA